MCSSGDLRLPSPNLTRSRKSVASIKGPNKIVPVYVNRKFKDLRQRPSAVTFLTILRRLLTEFDDVTLVSLMQIRCSEEFIIFHIDVFISTFIICHKFTVEHSVHLYTVVSLYVSHSFEHYTISVF